MNYGTVCMRQLNRIQDWTSERSLSSDPMLPAERTDSSTFNNNAKRFVRRGSGTIKNIFHGRSTKDALRNEFMPKMTILNPQGQFLQKWNKAFVLSCVLAVSIDPFFFYIPVVTGQKPCLSLDRNLQIMTSVLRSFADIFYMLHIIFQFRTGYIAPSSRVFGRGVLVEIPSKIAKKYLSTYFLVDLLSVLPLPQIVILIIIPKLKGGLAPSNAKNILKYVVLLQYVPRFARIFPLKKQITRSAGMLAETALAGALLNLLLYMLASHICGALWYLLSIERQDACWRMACKGFPGCTISSVYCQENSTTEAYFNKTCPIDPKNATVYDFGIYLAALQNVAQLHNFSEKFFYCFWWGLQNLSSLGQGLMTTTYVWENVFAVFIAISGLVLFSLLIGNMQTYLQSTTVRIEEMRVKRQDAEQWMSHRLLPDHLRERIRRHEQYRWQETRGVDEEDILSNLPRDLRRDIKRHLCLALLRRVPMFEKMDDQLIDAMCDRLKPVLYTERSCIIREGDPVNEMLFVMRGKLDSVTTNGGRTGFFNSDILKAGDFCGEELLTWALDPHTSSNLPISTRTVIALTEVQAFALVADDLKFVASQFRRLHSKQLRHTFRFYSQQWRTWAACFIQTAWRRYTRRKAEEALREEENRLRATMVTGTGNSQSLGAALYASRFSVNLLRLIGRRGGMNNRVPERLPVMLLPKPSEPDFTTEE